MSNPTTETVHAELVTGPPNSSPSALLIASDIEQCNKLYDLINAKAHKVREEAEQVCQLAVVLGIRLKMLKELTPHGKWKDLFQEKGQNLHGRARFEPAATKDSSDGRFAFSYDTARRYIMAAEGALARPGLPAKARKELLHLADPNADITPAHWDHLARATAGNTLRQLYLDLGIVRASAAEQANTPAPPAEKDRPRPPESDFIWQEICEAVGIIDQYVNGHGRIAQLDAPRIDHVESILAAALDTLRKINRA